MTERSYSLEEFADEVDINHPLTARRIPVLRGSHPRFKYHVGLVVGGEPWMGPENYGLEPDLFEIEQLCAYLEKTMRYYNDRYRKIVEARAPFDVDGTVNTHIFRKHAEFGWQYNVMTWTMGPTWFPTPPWHTRGPFTLEQLLDHIETFGSDTPNERWLAIKEESGAFAS